MLKDFATPSQGFNLCAIEVTKSCSAPRLNAAQNGIIYDISGSVNNIGFGEVFDIALSDSPAADGDFDLVDCTDSSIVLGTFPVDGPLAAGDQICYKSTITVSLTQNGLSDTITATANTESDETGVDLTDTATAQCPNLQVSPAIRVTKDCESSVAVINSQVVAQVTVSGTVCNIGDSNLSNVIVDDLNETTTPDPLVNGISLAKPTDPQNPENTAGACANYSGTYIPSIANDAEDNPTTDPSAVVFKDTVQATAVDIFGNAVTPHTDMADCPLCPP